MSKAKKVRICGIDTSLSSPGIAVIDVVNGKAKLVAVTHVKTDPKDDYVERSKHIEAATYLFLRQYRPFDTIVRESFASKFERSNYPVFTAWHSTDRALKSLGYVITEKSISPTTLKKRMSGKARKVTKEEVAEGVRKYLGDITFAIDDESDACGLALTWALDNGILKEVT